MNRNTNVKNINGMYIEIKIKLQIVAFVLDLLYTIIIVWKRKTNNSKSYTGAV